MSTPEPRFSLRTSVQGGNSRNCAKCMHNRCSAKAPEAQGRFSQDPRGPPAAAASRDARQASRCPAPRAPLRALTQGPGAALFDGFVLAPGRFLLQLPQDLFHLDPRRGLAADSERSVRGRRGEAAAAAAAPWPCAPRRPLRSPASGPSATTDESRSLHAAGHVSPVAPPRLVARVRCAPRARLWRWGARGSRLEWRSPDRAAENGPWDRKASRKGGGGCPESACCRSVARLGPKKRLIPAGSQLGGASRLSSPLHPLRQAGRVGAGGAALSRSRRPLHPLLYAFPI